MLSSVTRDDYHNASWHLHVQFVYLDSSYRGGRMLVLLASVNVKLNFMLKIHSLFSRVFKEFPD